MAGIPPELIRRFAGLRVVVVGDLMLDRYVTGRVRRISPEAPVPIVEVERTFERPGGAANVAANLRGLGAQTSVVGLIGSDPDGERLRDVLSDAGLSAGSTVSTRRHPTTVKTRVVAHGQQIVRVDRESSDYVDDETARNLIESCGQIDSADVVVLSDYAKGVLSPRVCCEVIRRSREHGVPVIVDPKGSDYRRYTGATAVTPNQSEAAQALGVKHPGDLSYDRARQFLLGELAMDAALITQGELGMTLLLPTRAPVCFSATARAVADVTGAGDTAASIFALGIAAGASFEDAAFLANAGAGIVVGKAGAAAISADELIDLLQRHAPGRASRSR